MKRARSPSARSESNSESPRSVTPPSLSRRGKAGREHGGCTASAHATMTQCLSPAVAGAMKSTAVRLDVPRSFDGSVPAVTPRSPPCFGSLPFLLNNSRDDPNPDMWNEPVVRALTNVLTYTSNLASSNTLATSTCRAIGATIPLLKKNDDRGKQQALLIFAFLVDGNAHVGHMNTLSTALAVTSNNTARYESFLKFIAPAGSKAEMYLFFFFVSQPLRYGSCVWITYK